MDVRDFLRVASSLFVLGVTGAFMTLLLWVYLLSLALLAGGEINSVLLHGGGTTSPIQRLGARDQQLHQSPAPT